MDDLVYMSACEALNLFRTRKLSPVELMRALIENEEASETDINAFSYRYAEVALEEAKIAEDRYAGKGGSPTALEGIPIAVKDSGHIKGQPTSAGSLTTGTESQDTNSPINERVLKSGAIVHARTATPEFSCATFTHSKRWGVTRNPWNTNFTPGGSSGGAGAALAAGFTTLATGSDIAGSIRIPASCCGVVGYKPPYGRNPVDAPFNFDHYCHTGPMARSVSDIILLQNAMCGPLHGDSTLIYPKLELGFEYPGLSGLKIAWSFDLGFYEVDQVVRENTTRALEIFEECGALIQEVQLPWTWDHHHAGLVHLRHIFGTSIASSLKDGADEMTRYAREFAEASLISTAENFLHSQVMNGYMAQSFENAVSDFDVFVCPTTAIPAVAADFDHSQEYLQINGKEVEPMLGWVMTLPFNMLSGHPVISVPSGYSGDGVPTGIQIVGQPYRDECVFQTALAYEKRAQHWFINKENYPISANNSRNQQPSVSLST